MAMTTYGTLGSNMVSLKEVLQELSPTIMFIKKFIWSDDNCIEVIELNKALAHKKTDEIEHLPHLFSEELCRLLVDFKNAPYSHETFKYYYDALKLLSQSTEEVSLEISRETRSRLMDLPQIMMQSNEIDWLLEVLTDLERELHAMSISELRWLSLVSVANVYSPSKRAS